MPQTQDDDRTLDALIKVYECQLIMTQDTIAKLNELKECREELKLYRQREVRRLQQTPTQGENE